MSKLMQNDGIVSSKDFLNVVNKIMCDDLSEVGVVDYVTGR